LTLLLSVRTFSISNPVWNVGSGGPAPCEWLILPKITVLELPIRNGGEAVSCGAPNADYIYILVGQSVDPFSHQEPITEQFVLLCQELPQALIGIPLPPGSVRADLALKRGDRPPEPGGSSQ